MPVSCSIWLGVAAPPLKSLSEYCERSTTAPVPLKISSALLFAEPSTYSLMIRPFPVVIIAELLGAPALDAVPPALDDVPMLLEEMTALLDAMLDDAGALLVDAMPEDASDEDATDDEEASVEDAGDDEDASIPADDDGSTGLDDGTVSDDDAGCSDDVVPALDAPAEPDARDEEPACPVLDALSLEAAPLDEDVLSDGAGEEQPAATKPATTNRDDRRFMGAPGGGLGRNARMQHGPGPRQPRGHPGCATTPPVITEAEGTPERTTIPRPLSS